MSAALRLIPFLSSLEYPQFPFAAAAHQGRMVKDLNLDSTYEQHKDVQVREHIQNWWDQCRVVAHSLLGSAAFNDSSIVLTHDDGERMRGWMVHVASVTVRTHAVDRMLCLGWFAYCRSDQRDEKGLPKMHFEFCNAATALTPDEVLVLGKSSKRGGAGDISLAGFFGEGVKVEINRIVKEGGRVVYHTNNCTWTFGYSPSRVLMAQIEPQYAPERIPGLSLILLHNCPQSAFNRSDFLFLNKFTSIFASKCQPQPSIPGQPLFGLQVLLDPAAKGRVYVHGIFMEALYDEANMGHAALGLNYTGPLSENERGKLHITRERDSLRVDVLVRDALPGVFADELKHRGGEQALESLVPLVCALYATLSNSEKLRLSQAFNPCSCSIMYGGGSHHCRASKELELTASILLRAFHTDHGAQAIPVHKSFAPAGFESDEDREAKFLGSMLVAVPVGVLRWLMLAPEFPTLAKLWVKHARDVMLLPEYVIGDSVPVEPGVEVMPPLSAELMAFAMSIKSSVSQYFDDASYGNRLRFKDFSKLKVPNVRRLVPIKKNPAAASEPERSYISFFVLDICLLSPALIHTELQAREPSFKCAGGKCGCVLNTVVDDILRSHPAHLRHNLDDKFRRKFLSSLSTNLEAPAAANPPPPSGPLAGAAVFSSPYLAGLSLSGSAPGSAVEKKWGGLRSLVPSINNAAHKCVSPKHATTYESTIHLPAQASRVPIIDEGCGPIDGTQLRRLPEASVPGPFSLGLPVFWDVRTDLAHWSRFVLEPAVLQYLSLCVVALARHCFAYPLDRLRLLISDDSGEAAAPIAFNRDGCLFFNLVAMRALSEQLGQSNTLLACNLLDFWFPVFCHELAHNEVKEHNAKFATVLGHVTTKFLDKFCTLRQRLLVDPHQDKWAVLNR